MHDQADTDPGTMTRIMSKSTRWLPVAALVVAIVLAILVWMLRNYISAAKLAGYPGIFFLNFFGAVSMVLPVPGLISVCGGSVFLNPWLVGTLAGVGEALGEWSGYVVGYAGDTVFERFSVYQNLRPRVAKWMEKRGSLVLLLISVIPNPFFDLVGIAAGTVHFPFVRFMAIILAGKIIKGLMVAMACEYGISLLPWIT
ncbi:VTT domain-containing protein [Dehalococcoidia bacterium]|nr:VTT domain-containing protein [Dehalococcoidia bacterium]